MSVRPVRAAHTSAPATRRVFGLQMPPPPLGLPLLSACPGIATPAGTPSRADEDTGDHGWPGFHPWFREHGPHLSELDPVAAGLALVLPEEKLKASLSPLQASRKGLSGPSRATLGPSPRPIFETAGCRNYSFLVTIGPPTLHSNTTGS